MTEGPENVNNLANENVDKVNDEPEDENNLANENVGNEEEFTSNTGFQAYTSRENVCCTTWETRVCFSK